MGFSNSLIFSFSYVLIAMFSLMPYSSSSSSCSVGDFLHCLSLHAPDTLVYTRNDTSYLPILESSIQNLRFWPSSTKKNKPQLIVVPFHDSHVQATVICCKECHMELKVRSNGHDYEGISYVSDVPFVLIDLFRMNSIYVDVKQGSAWVEAGATLGEVYYNIANKSKTYGFPAGICPTVGVGGHISGGGFGIMVRKYGLAADNVLDARIVNADGEILNKTSMDDDLFWAIRGGGGGSFGVILSWKIKLVPIPENVTVFTMSRDLEHGATALVHKWQHIAHKLPKDLYIKARIDRAIAGQARDDVFNTINVTFQSLFLGGTKQLLNVIQQNFSELGLKTEHCEEMSWIQSVLYFAGLDPYGPLEVLLNRTQARIRFSKSASDYVKEPMSEATLEGIWKIFFEKQVEVPHMMWVPSGGLMKEISPSEIPYPHRRNIYQIEYTASWEEQGTEAADRNINWIRRLYRHMEQYVSKAPREAYLNFRDLNLGQSKNGTATYEEAKAWGLRYFMGNYNRLVRVKTRVDQGNFFRNEQSIPVLDLSAKLILGNKKGILVRKCYDMGGYETLMIKCPSIV